MSAMQKSNGERESPWIIIIIIIIIIITDTTEVTAWSNSSLTSQ
jgi:hypothetical protein